MNLWEIINIMSLESLAYLLKNALIDRRTGKRLPIEGRAIPLDKQEKVLLLLKILSGLKVLRHKPKLKEKLLFLVEILEGRMINVPMQFVNSKITIHQRN